jgi:hypothetical protein
VSEGIAALLGAIVGAVATIPGIVLTDYLAARRADKMSAPAKALLTPLMNAGYGSRSLATLSNIMGADEQETANG